MTAEPPARRSRRTLVLRTGTRHPGGAGAASSRGHATGCRLDPAMRTATLDRLLAVLVLAMAATGLLSLRAGAAESGWVFTVHAVLGGTLLAATLWKLARSVPRAVDGARWGRLAFASVVSLATVAALVGGFAWVASGRILSIGSWTVLTLHAWVGLALVPLVLVHLLPHRWRLLRPAAAPSPRVGRRGVLIGGALAGLGLAAFGLANVADRALGGERRFTGSRWLPSGGIPPPTTFYGEGPPTIDPAAWLLSVVDGSGARMIDLAGLEALGQTDLTAVLDCTSGWAIETGWRGVPLSALLEVPDRGSVRVTSATGWTTVLTADEARLAFLATGVAGVALPAANGAPCRLVVPDRRGLDWIKWVTEVRVV